MSTPLEIAIGTHFQKCYGTKSTLVYLPVDGEVWSPWYQAAQCNQKTPIPVSSR